MKDKKIEIEGPTKEGRLEKRNGQKKRKRKNLITGL